MGPLGLVAHVKATSRLAAHIWSRNFSRSRRLASWSPSAAGGSAGAGRPGADASTTGRAVTDHEGMEALAYVAAAVTGLWGVAHAIPTRQVLAEFAPITADNRRVLEQEWLAETVTMWGVATLVVVVTATASDADVTAWVYRVAAGLLVALAVFTAFTGARTPVVWFKICPALLGTSAALLVAASVL